MAQAGGEGAELAGALQCHGLGVEHPGGQHLPEHRQQRTGIAQRLGEVIAYQFAVGIQVLQIFNLELGGNRHCINTLNRWFQMIGVAHGKDSVRKSRPAPQHE
ncbi:hypothetical protein D9M71_706780 [compost metagenome]